jgi:hypothetical protein
MKGSVKELLSLRNELSKVIVIVSFLFLAEAVYVFDATYINAAPPIRVCSDGLDNDGDGYTDWPADPDCKNKNGSTEGVPVPTSIVPYSNTFDDDPTGGYTLSLLNNDWNSPPWENGVSEGRVSIVSDQNAYSGKSMRVFYPEGWNTAGQGAQWILDFDESYNELYVSYRVKFSDNFDFVKGGKLPGFTGGTANTGSNKPDGTDGWSTRVTWREDGAITMYVYHPDQQTEFGEHFSWTHTFVPGVWHTIEARILMNTPGQYDGIIQAWLDGIQSLNVTNMRFRDVSSFAVDSLRFSTFFGGGNSTYAPTKDEFIYFDDFVISTERIMQ